MGINKAVPAKALDRVLRNDISGRGKMPYTGGNGQLVQCTGQSAPPSANMRTAYSLSSENLRWSSHTPFTSRQRLDRPSGIKLSFSITVLSIVAI